MPSLRKIQCKIERVEIAPAMIRIQPFNAPVDDQRHALLRDSAVRTQRQLELRQVMPAAAGAKYEAALGYDDDVADAIGRQFEALRRFGARQDQLDSDQRT